ncbi:MAG: alpha/beta hydrolase [Roseiflexaceae bacterium]|nr:alpha/beta hydrolase [Roseiflexaceae bacterium]
MQPSGTVNVTSSPWIVFEPASLPTTGFIFYPGARVDERSYAPPLRALAEQGFLAVIVPMPLNLAIFDPSGAERVIAAYPQITHWAIGGHSMGGAMAATYANDNLDVVKGLVLWAAYPQESDSLAAQQGVLGTAVFGTNDGLVDELERQQALDFMPPEAASLLIAGGNHAQFGSYGDQPNDGVATITRADQQAQTVAATLELLRNIAER